MHDVKRKYAFSARLKMMHRHALKNESSFDFKSILLFGVSNPPNASIISLKRSILVNLLSNLFPIFSVSLQSFSSLQLISRFHSTFHAHWFHLTIFFEFCFWCEYWAVKNSSCKGAGCGCSPLPVTALTHIMLSKSRLWDTSWRQSFKLAWNMMLILVFMATKNAINKLLGWKSQLCKCCHEHYIASLCAIQSSLYHNQIWNLYLENLLKLTNFSRTIRSWYHGVLHTEVFFKLHYTNMQK